jgi:methionyl-tRNA formyltransferase
MKIAILTSPNQWFESYAAEFSSELDAVLFKSHEDIIDKYDILFLLAYHKMVPEKFLKKNTYNLIVHESNLPKGKGWAPLFWQVLEGKNIIKLSLLEASSEVDGGNIYFQDELKLSGFELNSELRDKQAKLTIKMCKNFISKMHLSPRSFPQEGEESFFRKRTAEDSCLDVNKTIADQFNLLRVVDNSAYPAFFEIDGHRYFLKITRDRNE